MLKTYFSRMKSKASCEPRKPLNKILWSFLGSFLGIYLIAIFGRWFSIEDSFFLLGSFGASAVLIYGAPQAAFSQPRNLVGGHILSALVSVCIVKLFSSIFPIEVLCALSVSLAIMLMHYSCTMHPPGGATALIYVIGSNKVQALGWLYPFTPIAIGALLMLLVALFVNNLSQNDKRHYPTYWF
ncbi:HPP family protein [Malaciobacter mytili]|nr:HPP family protein [Malaciobacter mytili]AXH14916.1 HPP family membrane protein [Malaciobacter mytili LMG 24559]